MSYFEVLEGSDDWEGEPCLHHRAYVNASSKEKVIAHYENLYPKTFGRYGITVKEIEMEVC
jgi:hypothetical protein